MPTDQILTLLIAERDKLNRAIDALQGSAKRRGRPGKAAVAVIMPSTSPAMTTNGRGRGMSAAARKAQSARMKALWAKRRRQAAAKKSK